MRYRKISKDLAAEEYMRANESASVELRKKEIEEKITSEELRKKELNEQMTPEELRKAEVEKEMQRIRAIAKYRKAASAELLQRQEEEQKVKIEALRQKLQIEALRQKLQRERQAQIIKEMQERNAVEHKATVKAAQIAARKEQETREAGRTSDFNLEEKDRKLMETEVDLELAEDDLKETKAAQDRMKETEKYMKELREEQAKKIEEEKAQKTNAIQNIFKKLTSWPRRKIPTQEELNSDSIKEETAAVNTAVNKKAIDEKATETLRESESTKKEDEEEEKRKIKEAIFANKAANVIKRYTSSNLPLSRKVKKNAKDNEFYAKYGGFQVDEAEAIEAVNNSQKNYSDGFELVM